MNLWFLHLKHKVPNMKKKYLTLNFLKKLEVGRLEKYILDNKEKLNNFMLSKQLRKPYLLKMK